LNDFSAHPPIAIAERNGAVRVTFAGEAIRGMKIARRTRLAGSFRTQNSWYGLQQDVEIEPRRPIADIEKILFPENLQIALAPGRDLP
jgi:hypothetical protein